MVPVATSRDDQTYGPVRRIWCLWRILVGAGRRACGGRCPGHDLEDLILPARRRTECVRLAAADSSWPWSAASVRYDANNPSAPRLSCLAKEAPDYCRSTQDLLSSEHVSGAYDGDADGEYYLASSQVFLLADVFEKQEADNCEQAADKA